MTLLKCPRCNHRTVSGGRKICDRCAFELRQEKAREIARQVEVERARYNRTQPKMPEIVQGYRIASRELPKPIIRNWWEVGYIMPNGVRRVEKHSDYRFAVTRYNILKVLMPNGLQFHSVQGNIRRKVDPL